MNNNKIVNQIIKQNLINEKIYNEYFIDRKEVVAKEKDLNKIKDFLSNICDDFDFAYIKDLKFLKNVIIISIKMDLENVSIPSLKAEEIYLSTYLKIDNKTKEITKYIKNLGYSAYTKTSMSGPTPGIKDFTNDNLSFSLIANKTNIGKIGKNNLILTEKNGPRHRLGIVYTNISNLKTKKNQIKNPCINCDLCIKACPVMAITEEGVDYKKCFEYFENNHSCGICIDVCPVGKT